MTAEAFRRDYLPLRDDMYRLAYYILESGQDAEDAVQDLYLKLWSSGNALDSVRNPKPYCISLMRNICIDRLRKSKPERTDNLPQAVSDETPQDERLDGRQQVEAILGRISRLPEKERTVLRMRVFDGLDYKEIQERTGLSYLNLRVLLSNARRKIKTSLN